MTITKSQLFKNAHSMAKTMTGNYAACLKLALIELYQAIKDQAVELVEAVKAPATKTLNEKHQAPIGFAPIWFANKCVDVNQHLVLIAGNYTQIKETEKAVQFYDRFDEKDVYIWVPKSILVSKEELEAQIQAEVAKLR